MTVRGSSITYGKIRLLKKNILAYELEFGIQIHNGIIIPDDDATLHGIHARWAKVYKVGPDIDDLKPGDYILIDHGRWSRGFKVDEGDGDVLVRWVDYKDVFIVTDEKPRNYTTK